MAEFILTPEVKALALKSLADLRGEVVFIVNAETSKPVRIGQNGQVTAKGGLGKAAQFKVVRGAHPHQLGPVVRFHNLATGKYLAIKGGKPAAGDGGKACEFIVQQAQMAVHLKKHHNPKAKLAFNGDGSPVGDCKTVGDGGRGRFFIFDVTHVVKVPAHHPPPAAAAAAHHAAAAAHHAAAAAHAAEAQAHAAQEAARHQQEIARQQQEAAAAAQRAAQAQIAAAQQAAANAQAAAAAAAAAAHHQHHPPAKVYAPSAPVPGHKCMLRIVDKDLFLHISGGSKEGGKAVLHGDLAYGLQHPNSHFVLRQTAIPHTFLIEAAGTGLFLHAYGGSKDGMEIVLHGDEKYARAHPNSKFQVHPHGQGFVLKVHDADLCVHAWGGSAENAAIKLHGDVGYSKSHVNSQFLFYAL